MKKLLFVFTLLFFIPPAFAQNRSRTELTGFITDAKTGEALAGASVMLAETKIGTTTDSLGSYRLTRVPFGHTLIEISYEGYRSKVEHVDIVAGTNTKNFTLTASIVENEAVTVTAVGSATSIRKAPIQITRVNKAQLLSAPSTNIIDAISRQPGVSQLTTGPAISKPVIRGLGYNRLIVINDGVRQEGQQWGDEHGIEIDENSVSRVEIVKGPASLIYGSDALAGVVNIITTAPVATNTIKGNIQTAYGTNNRQRSLYGSIGGNQHGFNWTAWGDYVAAADYKNKFDGPVWNSKFNGKNFGGYVGYNGSWGYTHLIASQFNQRIGVIEGERNDAGDFIKQLPGGGAAVPTTDDNNSTDPFIPYQHVRHFKLIADNSFKAGSGRISVNLGWQRNQRQEYGNADEPGMQSLFFDLQTFNYNAAYHFNHKTGWATSIGINGMAQENRNKAMEALIPEYNLFDIGGFLYSQKTISKTTLSGGLRFDNRTLHSKEFREGSSVKFSAFENNYANFSGSAGLSYAINNDLLVKFNLARGFRAPAIAELATNGAHEGTNRYEYGRQDLVSENSGQADLGVEFNTEHIYLTAAAFYNSINHFIFYRKLNGANGMDSLVAVDNDLIPAYTFDQQNARLAGFEFQADLHPHPLDWLHWQNTFSFVQGRFREAIEGTKNLPAIPPTRWISQLRVELPAGKSVKNIFVHVEADHSFGQNDPFTAYETETATPGYTLINAGITANITRNNKTLFSLYLLGHNLSDVAYQNHLSRLKYTAENRATGRPGVYNMGRNFVFRVNIPLAIISEKK